MNRRTFIKTGIAAAGASAVLQPFQTRAEGKKYVFGCSQSSLLGPWRERFNTDMKNEAQKHPEIELIITDGQNEIEKQVHDVESLIQRDVDILLISPLQSAGLTGVVLSAIDAKIPVVILDQNVSTDRYTAFIGGDNFLIGKTAGAYAVKLLGGAGAAKGNFVELWGAIATQTARDRHEGFYASVGREAGVKSLLQPIDCDWEQGKAYDVMTTALDRFNTIDLVYGHSDPIAYGAYLAAKDAGREKEIKFLGIDALPQAGVTWVCDGKLTATFLYPNPGAEGIRQGLRIVKGERVEKRTILPTLAVDKSNCETVLVDSNPPTENPFIEGLPRPSARLSVRLCESAGKTLGELSDNLFAALNHGGYTDRAIYPYRDGFAVLTRVEQHDEAGDCSTADRWVDLHHNALPLSSLFSMRYLRALFFGKYGVFRFFIFALTSESPHFSGQTTTEAEASNWLLTGPTVLPNEVKAQRTNYPFVFTSAVYEFNAAGNDSQFVDQSKLTGLAHLLGTKIVSGFDRSVSPSSICFNSSAANLY